MTRAAADLARLIPGLSLWEADHLARLVSRERTCLLEMIEEEDRLDRATLEELAEQTGWRVVAETTDDQFEAIRLSAIAAGVTCPELSRLRAFMARGTHYWSPEENDTRLIQAGEWEDR